MLLGGRVRKGRPVVRYFAMRRVDFFALLCRGALDVCYLKAASHDGSIVCQHIDVHPGRRIFVDFTRIIHGSRSCGGFDFDRHRVRILLAELVARTSCSWVVARAAQVVRGDGQRRSTDLIGRWVERQAVHRVVNVGDGTLEGHRRLAVPAVREVQPIHLWQG